MHCRNNRSRRGVVGGVKSPTNLTTKPTACSSATTAFLVDSAQSTSPSSSTPPMVPPNTHHLAFSVKTGLRLLVARRLSAKGNFRKGTAVNVRRYWVDCTITLSTTSRLCLVAFFDVLCAVDTLSSTKGVGAREPGDEAAITVGREGAGWWRNARGVDSCRRTVAESS